MIKIDYDKIKGNYLSYASKKKVYAVVKDNAYNFGIKNIYTCLKKLNCQNYAVITSKEAIYLRKLNKKINILLLSDFEILDMLDLIKHKITLTVSSLIKYKCLKKLDLFCNIQLKVDTGMHRFGLSIDEYYQILEDLKKPNNKLNLTGIYTHMATDYKNSYYNFQLEKFKILVKEQTCDIHFSSSSGVIDDEVSNAIRIGIGLYDNAIKITGKIKKIFTVNKDEAIGYDLLFRPKKTSIIGIVDIGYSDGLIRANTNRYAFVKNKKVKIVGAISMNNCYVLLDKTVNINDEVEFLGENITLAYVAKYLKTTPHEILLLFLSKLGLK